MTRSFISNGLKLWQENSFLQLQTYYQLAAQHDIDVCTKADLKLHYQYHDRPQMIKAVQTANTLGTIIKTKLSHTVLPYRKLYDSWMAEFNAITEIHKMPSTSQTKNGQIYCFFSSHNTEMLYQHTILCNWLVCKRPLSPRFDRHTMSSFPMLVAPVRRRTSDVRLAWGARQYRNWRLAWGCSTLTWPKTDSSFTVVFNAVTVIKAYSCNAHKLKISYSSKE